MMRIALGSATVAMTTAAELSAPIAGQLGISPLALACCVGAISFSYFNSLAMALQCAAALPGKMNGIDTHWIWREGRERLTKAPMQIMSGCIDLPNKGGLGIEADRAQIEKAHQLYMDKCHGKGARNDAVGMRRLIPGWTFDNKKPCMAR